MRRRLAFETSPSEFAAAWEEEQAALRDRIAQARSLLPDVILSDDLLTTITRLCCEFDVDGLRADIVMYKTARVLAALDDRRQVNLADVRSAAELVLPHRRRRRPFEQTGLDREQLDRSLDQSPGDRATANSPNREPAADSAEGEEQESSPNDATGDSNDEKLFPIAPPQPVRPIELAQAAKKPASSHGRRNASQVAGARALCACDSRRIAGRIRRRCHDPRRRRLAVVGMARSSASSDPICIASTALAVQEA